MVLDDKYLTVKTLTEKYPAFTPGGVRHWLSEADKNGFNSCVIRIGSNILINREAFEMWVESHGVIKNDASK